MKDQFAYAQWTWGTQTREEFISSCADLAEIGYHHFESVSTFIDTFQGKLDDFRAITKDYDVKPVSFYFPLIGNTKEDLSRFRERMKFVVANDVKTICVQAENTWTPATEEDLRNTLNTLNVMAKVCAEQDVTICLHPHYNSNVMYEKDVDFIMQNTDPKRITLAPDTAHLVAGNCDLAAIFERYKERIRFVHLKDITDVMKTVDVNKREPDKIYDNFRELGEGIIDFPKLFSILRSVGYSGYLCVELDRTRFTNKESAEISLRYLREHW